MKKKSIILISAIVVVIASIAIMGTLAYFTATDTATNTFTVGDISMILDEAEVEREGNLFTTVDPETRIDANIYDRVYPGAYLPKDPMVTIKAESEDCYVRIILTIDDISGWASVLGVTGKFDDDKLAIVMGIFEDYDKTVWVPNNYALNADNSCTIEFRYVDVVPYSVDDTELPKLFTGINMPDFGNGQLSDFNMELVAQAIQAAGFSDTTDDSDPPVVTSTAADNAWANFPTTP